MAGHELAWDNALMLRLQSRLPPVGTASIVVFTLAVGISASTALCTLLYATLWKPLTYTDSKHVVGIYGLDSQKRETGVSWQDLLDLSESASAISHIAGFRNRTWGLTDTSGQPLEVVLSGMVTPDFFQTLGVVPQQGQGVLPEFRLPGGARAIWLSDSLWRARYGAAPEIVGQTVSLNDEPYLVAGVLPASFRFPIQGNLPDVYILLSHQDYCCGRRGRSLGGIAKLTPGASRDQVQSELAALSARLATAFPESNAGFTFVEEDLQTYLFGSRLPPLILIGVGVALPRELHNKNAAVFAGAGLSMASGYVDWKGLLSEIIQDLGLDPQKEHDLVTIAQYHCNKAGGSKTHLTQTIFNHFAPAKSPTPAHCILANLPIFTYWTTNYDKLIEKALEGAKKVPDVKYALKQLSVTRPDRDVVVYKMHGDIDHPADAIISKDEYEAYPLNMAAFVSALRGDLVERTFLFVGFSFTDPNIDFILSRVRVQYETHQRHHYCIQKRVSKGIDESNEDFKYRELKQDYFIRDLKRFSVYTVLVDEYSEITEILAEVAANYKRSSVFISGAAEDYGPWLRADAETFIHNLSHQIAAKKNRVITGFGVGVGGAVINGALAYLNEAGKTISDEDLVMRPFPQVATGTATLAEQWTGYRQAMLDYAGIAIFVFGNKRNPAGDTVLSDGMLEEFELCVERGVQPLPMGATGFMAKELWDKMMEDLSKFYPKATPPFVADFQLLGDTSKSADEIRVIVQRLIEHLQKA